VINTPELSNLLGSTPMGPPGCGQALLAAAAAAAVSALAPQLLVRISEALTRIETLVRQGRPTSFVADDAALGGVGVTSLSLQDGTPYMRGETR
jgi:hypothetical protein